MAAKTYRAHTMLINSTRSGIVYDSAGHSLGGGERMEVDSLDDVGKAAVDCGYLHTVEVKIEE